MRNILKTFLFFSLIFFSVIFYYRVYQYQVGRTVKAEWWLVDVQKKKEQIVSQEKGRKVIVVSGSNGLFGIDSNVISQDIGIPTYNLALHAGLDISYYEYLIKKLVRKGDIVIMPLEYEYYSQSNPYSDWFINNMNAWGEPYINNLSLKGRLSFFAHTSLFRVLSGVSAGDSKMTTPDIYIEKYQGNKNGFNYGYRYSSLNSRGDFNIIDHSHAFSRKIIKSLDSFESDLSYGKNVPLSADHMIDSLQKIKYFLEKKEAKLYVTWPASISSKFFNPNDLAAKNFTTNIRNELQKENIITICDNFYANLPIEYFLDSRYHLNSDGAKIRSHRLSSCLKQKILN